MACPPAAFGGRAEVMERLAPLGPVYQAGTLSGNPVAVAAGLATLRAADDAVYAALDANADRLAGLLSRRPDRSRCAAPDSASRQHAQRVLRRRAGDRLRVRARPARRGASPPFFHALLDGASTRRCSAFEAWFVSAALDDAAFDRIADALPAAARAARRRPEDQALMAEQTRVHVDAPRRGAQPRAASSTAGCRDSTCPTGAVEQAAAVADALADRDIVAVIASPLQRAQETAAPIAATHDLTVDTDHDLIESANFFEGRRVGPGDGALARPAVLVAAAQPVHPVVG